MSLLQTAKDAGMVGACWAHNDGTNWVAAFVCWVFQKTAKLGKLPVFLFEALASTSLALSIGFRCRHLHLGGFLTWSFSLRLQQGPKKNTLVAGGWLKRHKGVNVVPNVQRIAY